MVSQPTMSNTTQRALSHYFVPSLLMSLSLPRCPTPNWHALCKQKGHNDASHEKKKKKKKKRFCPNQWQLTTPQTCASQHEGRKETGCRFCSFTSLFFVPFTNYAFPTTTHSHHAQQHFLTAITPFLHEFTLAPKMRPMSLYISRSNHAISA